MFDYRKESRSQNSRGFGKPRFNREQREMFSATCANCGKNCEVPFKPTGNKPVYCRDCFKNNQHTESKQSSSRRFDHESQNRPRYQQNNNVPRTSEAPNYAAQFAALNAKVDKILSLLTAPTVAAAPAESAINETVIAEIAAEVADTSTKTTKEKPIKAKATRKKKTTAKESSA